MGMHGLARMPSTNARKSAWSFARAQALPNSRRICLLSDSPFSRRLFTVYRSRVPLRNEFRLGFWAESGYI